eukprot:GHUV01034043.1.p1 GENE.GHUV01034043.1~~GHUV01034043.1.p1  ORF type:complete len:125 (-),score=32.61 GHUV01034043.1:418-792(-)
MYGCQSLIVRDVRGTPIASLVFCFLQTTGGHPAALQSNVQPFTATSCRRNDLLVSELSIPAAGSQPLKFERPFAASTREQFKVLMARWLRSYWRHPGYNATRFAFCTVLAVLLGTIYLWFGQRR